MFLLNVAAAIMVSIPGLNWGAPVTQIRNFAVSAGFSSYEYVNGYHTWEKGKWAGRNVSLAMAAECAGVGFHSFKVYYPVSASTYEDVYNELVSLYKVKYGQPSHSFKFFRSPYKEGDGYEYQAIRVGKGTMSTYWGENFVVGIVVEQSGAVTISYQDSARFSTCKNREDKANAGRI
jgi:hypothetical protein